MPNTPALSVKLAELATSAQREFEDVGDYIWKSPRLIEHEMKLEKSKLNIYFKGLPDESKFQRFRWHRESHKLHHTFPYLISVGNLLSLLSLFESYLLLLAAELQAHTKVPLSSSKGQGVNKLFNYIKSLGIKFEEIPIYEQIQSAIRIRNCLAHASGMLSWSRDSHQLRIIQSNGLYLSREHRIMRTQQGREFHEILIVNTELGERISVDNKYCHVLCSYLISFYCELCTSTYSALCEQSGIKNS